LPGRSQRRADADAVVERQERRVLARRSGAALRAADHGSGLWVRGDQRRGAGALSVFAADVDEAANCDAQAASRLRPRLARVPVPAEPEDPRLPPPPRARNHRSEETTPE